jgi:hypothetical protein
MTVIVIYEQSNANMRVSKLFCEAVLKYATGVSGALCAFVQLTRDGYAKNRV